MNVFSVIIVISPGYPGRFLCVHAISDGKGNSVFFHGVTCLFRLIDRACNDRDLLSLELLYQGLEVSQLLGTKRSPIPTIKQNYSVTFSGPLRKLERFSRYQFQLQVRKDIVRIQKSCTYSCHLFSSFSVLG